MTTREADHQGEPFIEGVVFTPSRDEQTRALADFLLSHAPQETEEYTDVA